MAEVDLPLFRPRAFAAERAVEAEQLRAYLAALTPEQRAAIGVRTEAECFAALSHLEAALSADAAEQPKEQAVGEYFCARCGLRVPEGASCPNCGSSDKQPQPLTPIATAGEPLRSAKELQDIADSLALDNADLRNRLASQQAEFDKRINQQQADWFTMNAARGEALARAEKAEAELARVREERAALVAAIPKLGTYHEVYGQDQDIGRMNYDQGVTLAQLRAARALLAKDSDR